MILELKKKYYVTCTFFPRDEIQERGKKTRVQNSQPI